MKTFHKGGVHPPENKLSCSQKTEILPVPATVQIPLSQHLGVPAKPVVEKGEKIKAGQKIAAASGFVSGNIHSSVSGTVVKIDKVLDSTGYKTDTVVVQTEGDDWAETIDRSEDLVKECKLSAKDIIAKIKDAGIVGLGGATFPTHVKLSIPRGRKAEYVLINGIECEPYLTADHALMLEKPQQLLVGVTILMKALHVEKAIIGIENNKPDAIDTLNSLAASYKGIAVEPLKVKYPQGGEKQFIKAVLHREVPSGGLPIDVGAVVFNVGTTFAVYEAVQKNKPLFERIITVTGKAVRKPSNFKVRIGTGIKELIDACGGIPEDTGKIVSGGPMMGKALSSIEIPVVKGSSGVLLIKEREAHRRNVDPCIRCSRCVNVCPMGLEPYLLMSLSERKMNEKLEAERVMDCIECGSCSYICPSARPLLDYIRLAKTSVGNIIRSRK